MKSVYKFYELSSSEEFMNILLALQLYSISNNWLELKIHQLPDLHCLLHYYNKKFITTYINFLIRMIKSKKERKNSENDLKSRKFHLNTKLFIYSLSHKPPDWTRYYTYVLYYIPTHVECFWVGRNLNWKRQNCEN